MFACNFIVIFAASEMTKRSLKMKASQSVKELKKAGCFLLRHGARHDIWFSPITGRQEPVPRHGSAEIRPKVLAKIRLALLGVK